jgi:NIMA (never in mitosis gene a)-related kinase
MKIFHRDLKSANVFLSKDGNAKLGDLNVSKVAKKGLLYTQTGTPYYASPEVWRDQPYDNKSDIWSLGCVLYEMTTLKPPFRANDMDGLYKRVLKGVYPKIGANYSQDLATMIKTLLQVESNIRPTCDQILAMDIVKKRMNLLKNLPTDEIPMDESFSNLNLLGTIKLPKNLANLAKDLPKANYISSRGDTAISSNGPPGGKKLLQSHTGQIRLQSEPALPNS